MKKLTILFSLALAVVAAAGASYVTSVLLTATTLPALTMPLTAVLFLGSLIFQLPKGVLASTPFLFGICEKVQNTLIDLLGSNSPELKRTMTGYLSAVKSPQNMAGVTIAPPDQGNGKDRQARITYLQRGCAADIVTTDSGLCTAEVFKSPLEKTVSITRYIATKWMGFNESDMRKLCEEDSSFRARVMNSEIDSLMVGLNKALIVLQNANFGKFSPFSNQPAYSTSKNVNLLNLCGNGIDYSGESDIIEDFKLLDTTSKPILIGAGKLSKYVSMAKVGCCNDIGINTGLAGQFDFFHDRFVESIIGANGFIGLVPGYVQLLTWNRFVGDYKKESPSFAAGTVLDPITGITLDMEWKYDDCKYQYIMRFALYYELFFIPVDSFATCDDLSGVNFTLPYTAKNGTC